MRVGTARGSTAKRLRPVGSTSSRARAGAPEGPGCTKPPSRAVMRWRSSAGPQRPSFAARSRAPLSGTASEAACLPTSSAAPNTLKPVADAHLLDVAEPGVEPGERGRGFLAVADAAIGGEAARMRPLDDGRAEQPGAARIERERFSIFVEQRFEVARRAMRAGLGERRRHMADRHRADAPLGLRRLAGVVDDEGVDHRNGAEHHLGSAGGVQRHGLARQPLQRAVRAEMHQRVDAFDRPKPEIEGDVAVARRSGGVVIVGAPLPSSPAVGLDRHQQTIRPNESEGESTIQHRRIVAGLPPGPAHGLVERLGQRGRSARA